MVRLIGFIALLTLIVACNEETPSGQTLNATELANLRQVSANKCRSENTSRLKTLTDGSNKVYTNLVRGNTWKHVFKVGTTASAKSQLFTVWKVTASDIYFLVKLTDPEASSSSSTSYRFLKISKAMNTAQAKDLMEKYCNKTPTAYNSFSFDGSGASVAYLSKYDLENSQKGEETKTTKVSAAYPIFFGLYSSTRSKVTIDVDGKQVGTAEETSQTIETNADVSLLDEGNSGYYDAFGTTQYCIPAYSAGTPNTFAIPAAENCTTSRTGLTEFDPAVELVL